MWSVKNRKKYNKCSPDKNGSHIKTISYEFSKPVLVHRDISSQGISYIMWPISPECFWLKNVEQLCNFSGQQNALSSHGTGLWSYIKLSSWNIGIHTSFSPQSAMITVMFFLGNYCVQLCLFAFLFTLNLKHFCKLVICSHLIWDIRVKEFIFC
jgi:hypothetical protein